MFLNFSFCCGYGEERLESEIQQESPLCENFDSSLTYIGNLWRQKSQNFTQNNPILNFTENKSKSSWKFWRDLTTAWRFVLDLAHKAPEAHVVSGAWEFKLTQRHSKFMIIIMIPIMILWYWQYFHEIRKI